jgi:histidinol-phosphatase (PHP family)
VTRSSLHGGHSGQFCDHARDTLADIVAAYHRLGFERVGLSEHMPPFDESGLYPDEVERGRTPGWMQDRFARYVGAARRLASEYTERMRILVGMESEWYPGCAQWVARLREDYSLDYVVGSIHHVQGLCFDFSPADYVRAVDHCGGLERMYVWYFDAQLDMLQTIRPEVVGHFDLIRMHDPLYLETLAQAEVWARVLRNLEWIRDAGAILDVNARALLKGQAEPYVCAPILEVAGQMGIAVAYGDDAHAGADVGYGLARVEELLAVRGCGDPEL